MRHLAAAALLVVLFASLLPAADVVEIRDALARRADVIESPSAPRLSGSSPLAALTQPAAPDVTRAQITNFRCFATNSDNIAGNPSVDCTSLIKSAVSRYKKCPEVDRVALTQCTIKQESSGVANAMGPWTKYGYAKGMMQLLDSTFSWIKNLYRLDISQIFNAGDNINAGTAYHDFLLVRYNCDVDSAITAYHAGQGNFDAGKIGPDGREYHAIVSGCYRGTA
ncbi:MAG: transglycosylase SLT domain-containing protein [Candidatus Micrarchaeota archaeon]